MKGFIKFIVAVFTRTPAVLAVLAKVSSPTLAAIMAVFYDIMKFVIAEAGNVESIKTNGIATSLSSILSDQTAALLANIATDFVKAEKTVVADFHQLEIAATTDSTEATITTAAA